MTERVDYDLLADFVGGALDGTPEATTVRRLIVEEDAWADAYADLVAADSAVSAALAGYAAEPATMPSDLATRIDSLLRTPSNGVASERKVAAAETTAGRGRHTMQRQSDGRTRPAGTGPGRTTRRRRTLQAALSAVAAVIAVGVGLVYFVPQVTTNGGGGTTSSTGDKGAAAPAVDQQAGDVKQIASGRDYRAGQFGGLAAADAGARQFGSADVEGTAPAASAAPKGAPPAGGVGTEQVPVPVELGRLVDPHARLMCLNAIRSSHGGVATLVDYARFAGQPAMIVLLNGARTGEGRPWVVVVGPDCGTPSGYTDERYNGPTT